MSDTANDGTIEGPSPSMEPIEPAFEVGTPGVGPVTGIHTGEFFQSPPSDDQAADHDVASDPTSRPALDSPTAPAAYENHC